MNVQIICPKCGKVLGEMEGNIEVGQLKWTANCEHYAWAYTYDKKEAESRKNKALATVEMTDFARRKVYYMCLPIEVKEVE
jgi:transcription initiation factor IIE alpha subunit